jgi:hypothetical protein
VMLTIHNDEPNSYQTLFKSTDITDICSARVGLSDKRPAQFNLAFNISRDLIQPPFPDFYRQVHKKLEEVDSETKKCHQLFLRRKLL